MSPLAGFCTSAGLSSPLSLRNSSSFVSTSSSSPAPASQRASVGKQRRQPRAVFDIGEPEIVDIGPKIQRTKKVRRRTKGLVGEIDTEPDIADCIDSSGMPRVEDDDMAPAARTAVRAADARKGIDPVVVRVANVSTVTTFMVCVTGKNPPQIRAIANLVEEDLLKEHNLKSKRRSRTAESGWVLLDYGDLMVHVFSPEQRKNYNMEDLWRRGERLDISDCLIGPESAIEDVAVVDDEDDDWL
jgi:ribosome-associated protein